MQSHELVENEHGETPLLFVGLRGCRRNDGRDVWLGPRSDGKAAASLWGAPERLGGRLRLVDLRVICAEGRAGPARLWDQVLEEEDVVAEVGRVAQLVRERL